MKVSAGMRSSSVVEFVSALSRMESAKLMLIYLVVVFGAKFWINNVKRIEIRKLMVLYNFTSSFVNLYTFLGFMYHVITADSFLAETTNNSLKKVFYVYWISKIFELLDTVFMIIRHRGRQISFLHVFHHASMLVLTELAYKIRPVVSMASFLGINSFIHIVLYFYYGLSALHPESPPQWKKILTKMQIIQFVIDLILVAYGYSNGVYCVYCIFYGSIMLYMFSNFYYQAYLKPKKA